MVHADGSAPHDAAAGESPNGTDGTDLARPPMRWCRTFRGEKRELQHLRRWLTGFLPERSARDDLLSVVVELATNAIQHTASGQGGWFTVEVTRRGPVIRVAVADGGAPAGPCLNDDPMADCGRGLVIVRALSLVTGVSGDDRGRTVWAEVPWAPEPVARPHAGPDGGRRSADGRRAEPEALLSLLHDGGGEARGQ